MPKINYNPHRKFTRQWREIIAIANSILEDYERQGFDLTLRGLYYKFIGGNLFPDSRRYVLNDRGKWVKDPNGTKNAEPNYNWLGEIMKEARMAGLVDWNHLVDRTRNIRDLTHYENERDATNKAAGWYWIDFWENQGIRPEVWVEKDAQVGNMLGTCQELDVPLFSCRGYTSASAMWRAAQRLARHQEEGYSTIIIHLGDHDPSGVDMSRDIFDRMEQFMGGTKFNRIALNMDQVTEHSLPPDPAKVTDSRATSYINTYGTESWELDALEPAYINELITNTITTLRDDEQWEKDTARYKKAKANLRRVANRFPDLTKFMKNEAALVARLKTVVASLEKTELTEAEHEATYEEAKATLDLLV